MSILFGWSARIITPFSLCCGQLKPGHKRISSDTASFKAAFFTWSTCAIGYAVFDPSISAVKGQFCAAERWLVASLLLVAMPGAPSSVLAPQKARSPGKEMAIRIAQQRLAERESGTEPVLSLDKLISWTHIMKRLLSTMDYYILWYRDLQTTS